MCIFGAYGTKYLKSDLDPKVAIATGYYEHQHCIICLEPYTSNLCNVLKLFLRMLVLRETK